MLRTLKILILSLALVLAGVFLNACGNEHAQARFVHASPSPDASHVDFVIDGVDVATNLAFPSTNGTYISVTSGTRDVEVRIAGTTSDLVNAPNVNFINHDQYTLFFTGLTHPPDQKPPNQTINQVNDDNSAPANGNIKLRFFHASPSGPGHVDVYVVAPGTPITNLSPNVSGLGYQQASGYLNIAAASYEIIVTPTGSKSSVIDLPSTAFTAGQIRTFVVIDPPPLGCGMTLCFLELADLN